MKKLDKKAFTLIELLVVITIIGILVLFGAPRFTGYTQKAEFTRIQHDIKVMEQEVETVLINKDDDFNKWGDNNKDLNQLIQEGKLFEKEGIVKPEEFNIDETYKVIPEKHKDKINTKLKGTFYANSVGKVYYEHEKPLSGIPTEPEEEPGYSDKEIKDLIAEGFIPIAAADELNNVRINEERTYGKGTQWEDEYKGGLDKNYVQVLNIDLSGYSKDEGWNPIGNGSSKFTGSFDGNGYNITELTINRPTENNVGLFGYTEGATIRNVALEDVDITGAHFTGGLVGEAQNNTKISNSYATGLVTGSTQVGGLVGNANSSSTIEYSYAIGEVTGRNFVGGLVGYANYRTSISNSYATGSVSGTEENIGGLVGYANSSITITDSYATGSVTGRDKVGGLVGWADDSSISNSYATGSVEGTAAGYTDTGGLVGWANNVTINNSYATGSVSGTEENIGGLVGYARNGTIEKSYATGEVIGKNDVGGLVGWAGNNTIKNSYATGSVSGEDRIGGLVGYSTESTEISNSYATGSVTGAENIGGLVGFAGYGTIEKSYATGSVTGSSNAGGLVGWAGGSTISNSYWDTKTTRRPTSSGGGVGKTTWEMKDRNTYLGWDFDNVWKIDEGNGYPKLR